MLKTFMSYVPALLAAAAAGALSVLVLLPSATVHSHSGRPVLPRLRPVPAPVIAGQSAIDIVRSPAPQYCQV